MTDPWEDLSIKQASIIQKAICDHVDNNDGNITYCPNYNENVDHRGMLVIHSTVPEEKKWAYASDNDTHFCPEHKNFHCIDTDKKDGCGERLNKYNKCDWCDDTEENIEKDYKDAWGLKKAYRSADLILFLSDGSIECPECIEKANPGKDIEKDDVYSSYDHKTRMTPIYDHHIGGNEATYCHNCSEHIYGNNTCGKCHDDWSGDTAWSNEEQMYLCPTCDDKRCSECYDYKGKYNQCPNCYGSDKKYEQDYKDAWGLKKASDNSFVCDSCLVDIPIDQMNKYNNGVFCNDCYNQLKKREKQEYLDAWGFDKKATVEDDKCVFCGKSVDNGLFDLDANECCINCHDCDEEVNHGGNAGACNFCGSFDTDQAKIYLKNYSDAWGLKKKAGRVNAYVCDHQGCDRYIKDTEANKNGWEIANQTYNLETFCPDHKDQHCVDVHAVTPEDPWSKRFGCGSLLQPNGRCPKCNSSTKSRWCDDEDGCDQHFDINKRKNIVAENGWGYGHGKFLCPTHSLDNRCSDCLNKLTASNLCRKCNKDTFDYIDAWGLKKKASTFHHCDHQDQTGTCKNIAQYDDEDELYNWRSDSFYDTKHNMVYIGNDRHYCPEHKNLYCRQCDIPMQKEDIADGYNECFNCHNCNDNKGKYGQCQRCIDDEEVEQEYSDAWGLKKKALNYFSLDQPNEAIMPGMAQNEPNPDSGMEDNVTQDFPGMHDYERGLSAAASVKKSSFEKVIFCDECGKHNPNLDEYVPRGWGRASLNGFPLESRDAIYSDPTKVTSEYNNMQELHYCPDCKEGRHLDENIDDPWKMTFGCGDEIGQYGQCPSCDGEDEDIENEYKDSWGLKKKASFISLIECDNCFQQYNKFPYMNKLDRSGNAVKDGWKTYQNGYNHHCPSCIDNNKHYDKWNEDFYFLSNAGCGKLLGKYGNCNGCGKKDKDIENEYSDSWGFDKQGSSYFDPIAYVYDADIHCPKCAEYASKNLDNAEDSEGNPVGVIFNGDSWEYKDSYCGTCGDPIIRYRCAECGEHKPGAEVADNPNSTYSYICNDCLGEHHNMGEVTWCNICDQRGPHYEDDEVCVDCTEKHHEEGSYGKCTTCYGSDEQQYKDAWGLKKKGSQSLLAMRSIPCENDLSGGKEKCDNTLQIHVGDRVVKKLIANNWSIQAGHIVCPEHSSGRCSKCGWKIDDEHNLCPQCDHETVDYMRAWNLKKAMWDEDNYHFRCDECLKIGGVEGEENKAIKNGWKMDYGSQYCPKCWEHKICHDCWNPKLDTSYNQCKYCDGDDEEYKENYKNAWGL